MTILYADDNLMWTDLVRDICRDLGRKVEVAVDGVQAVTMAQTTVYSLIIMDIHMPQMNGIEAAAAIRSLPSPNGEAPIYAMTGDAAADVRELCVKYGFRDILLKPFRLAQFEAILKELG